MGEPLPSQVEPALALPHLLSLPLQLHLLAVQLCWLNRSGHWLELPLGQVHSPEAWPFAVCGEQLPLAQVIPHWPQLVASWARSLQTVPQQTAPG